MDNNQKFTVENNNVSTANNGKGYITYCSRCGSEMYSNSRYCMKCGNLNPDHPDNQGVIKYIEKKGEGYSVGSGQSLIKKETNILKQKSFVTAVGEYTGNFNLCFAVNMILYLVITFGSCFYYYLLARGDFISIISSNLGEILLGFSIFFFAIYSLELVFMKMNRQWWLALIPFVNCYVIADAVIGNDTLSKLCLIPGLGQILLIYVFYKMGEGFHKPGIIMVLFPVIMIPWIAFGGSAFYGTYYISGTNRLEDEFHMKRILAFFLFFFAAASTVSLSYTNTAKLKSESGKLDVAYIVNTANTVIRNVKNKVEKDAYTCDFEDADSFYFHFADVSDYFYIPFSFSHSSTEAYVRVEKVKVSGSIVKGKYNYYISISDGRNGFAELSSKNINYDQVVEYPKISREYDDGNDCFLHEKS
jgi:hypothetical protein